MQSSLGSTLPPHALSIFKNNYLLLLILYIYFINKLAFLICVLVLIKSIDLLDTHEHIRIEQVWGDRWIWAFSNLDLGMKLQAQSKPNCTHLIGFEFGPMELTWANPIQFNGRQFGTIITSIQFWSYFSIHSFFSFLNPNSQANFS